MANTRSAKKRIRQNRSRRLQNRQVRTRARTSVKAARDTAGSPDKAKGQAAVLEAIRELDKAASKGIIHRNNSARRKSRLLRALKKSTG
ncbi:MAG TPA: 30S ribosomal protein S20 [Anaerolineales bacterium]|nr:30S ribosomal protein S20 [Anaerolineales bacterium]